MYYGECGSGEYAVAMRYEPGVEPGANKYDI